MKKMLKFTIPPLFIFLLVAFVSGCSNIGLGSAVYYCSVCGTCYANAADRDVCANNPLCPGRSSITIEEQEEEIQEQKVEIRDLHLEIEDLEAIIGEKLKYIRELDAFIDARREQLGLTEADLADANSRYSAISAAIDNLITTKKQLEQEVVYLEQTVKEKEQKIESLEVTIKEKEVEISELNVTIKEKEQVIKEKEQIIELKEQVIKEKEAVIEKQELTIQEKVKRIEELDKTVAKLEEDIVVKDQIIVEKQAEIKQLNEEIVVKEQKIQELKEDIVELNETIEEQQKEIKEKEVKIEQQKVIIQQLSDALGSRLNFSSKGFSHDYSSDSSLLVYPVPYLGRAWMSLTYDEQRDSVHYIPAEGGSGKFIDYKPREKGTCDVGYRGYDYWGYSYKLTVDNKNIIYQINYDTYYEDWSSTSSEEIRIIRGNQKLFDIFTGIVCLDVPNKIWVMKDVYNGVYTIIKEVGENQFARCGSFDALTDAIEVNLDTAVFTVIDYSPYICPN